MRIPTLFPLLVLACAAVALPARADGDSTEAIVAGTPFTAEQLAKFGYGPRGQGPSFSPVLNFTDEELEASAAKGDAAASHLLWQRLQSDGRLEDAERVALNQAIVTGHTFLLTLMGQRYLTGELSSNGRGDPHKANIWFQLAAQMGDPSAQSQMLTSLDGIGADPVEAAAIAQRMLAEARDRGRRD